MNLIGRVVTVFLSERGKRELAQLDDVPLPLDAFIVLGQDEVGIWAASLEKQENRQTPAIMLLKWEHLATTVFDYEPEAPVERSKLGFKP